MRIERLRFLAFIVAILMAYIFFTIIQHLFKPFEYANFPIDETLIPIDGDVGPGVSSVLWSKRQLDLIALATLVFVTAACCTTMLRPEKGEQD